MIKLLSTLVAGIMSIGTIACYKTDDISNVKNFFNKNLQILKAEHYKNFNIKWDVKSIGNINSHSSYYLVDQQYRQGAYQLYNGYSLIF